jgi:MFS transporter, CP family, cyanate transporter
MREFWVAVGLLWLGGAGLRMTILAVPPVIALIQADLKLSGTEIGVLSGLPVILFGLAALPGSLLIARFGALATLVAGLVVAGIASGLRGAVLNVHGLYAATIVMSAGVAIMQPSLPPLVRQWLPHRVGFGTALYTNGLLVGETLPVMLTLPLVFPLVDNSWRWSLAIWGVPLVLIAIFAAVIAPRPQASPVPAERPRWWPDWRNKLIWQLGFLLGSVNSVYFSINAFLPGYLTHVGRADLISGGLTALNFGQLPASFALLAIAGRLERRAWPFIACGVATLVCIAGIVTTASWWTVLFAGLFGFVGAAILTLGLALPPLLSAPGDVARMAAAMFTISYSEGLIVSVLSGAAWDLGGSPTFAFLPMAICALPLLFLPLLIRFDRPRGGTR